MHKDLRPLVRQLRKRGYTVEQARGSQHYHVRDGSGTLLYVLACSPGGGRWLQNAKAELRRKGLIE